MIAADDQLRDSAVHIHVSTFPQTLLSSRLPHNIEHSSMCCTVDPCWLSILDTSSIQSLSCVWLFATQWDAACQASLSITRSQSLLKLMSIESVMPSSQLILCHPLLLLPQIPPRIRIFSNESTLRMRWPKYWSFSFSISPSSEHPGLISFRMDWLDLLAVQGRWGRGWKIVTWEQKRVVMSK